GVYTYTVAATAPCTVAATATVTVTQQAQPNAGTNGTLTVCAGTTPTNAQLFAQLGNSPTAGGVWSGPVAGVYTYTVAATAPCTVAATATVTVTADPNSLCASYNGDYFANTASTTTGGSAIVTLIYNISSDPNVSCNNINALTADDFNLTIIPDNTVGSVVLVPNSKTYTNGVLTIKYTITLSPSAYSGTVQFTLGTSGNFTIDPDCSDNPLITVSTKVDGFVTGGGFIIPGKSGGSIGGSPVNGLRNNFGFNIKLNKGKLQGNWNTIIRRREAGNVVVYQVKSNVAKTMVITKISNTSYRADLSYASANFQNLTCSLCPVNANNGTVLVSVYDNGEPGANIDQILITIKDKNGNVWYTSDATANHSLSYTNLQLLNQGNIQIHATGTKMATTLRTDATLTQSALSRMDAASTTPATEFNLVALPNPSQTDFTLQVQSFTREKMQLKVADITGRTIQIIQNISAGQTLKLGSNYKPGVYLIELKQGNNRKQLKLVKL
ncbi:MAG TPA: T9SS type A sorting domain-containing protein, partial [Hanamia sp.]